MPYPREIYLDADSEERLISYMDEILNNHYAERGGHITDIQRWQKEYWAKSANTEDPQSTDPRKRGAQIIIPLSAIAIEAVHARNMTTRFGFKQLVSVEAVSADWEASERAVEKFLDTELLEEMRIRRPIGDAYLEATKFGTMIGKSGYERIVKTAVRVVGEEEQEFDVVVADGATFDAVADARFLMPHSSQDVKKATWCGEEHSDSPYNVMALERSGMFRPGTIIDGDNSDADPVNRSKLSAWISASTFGTTGSEGGRQVENTQAGLENTRPSWPDTLDWVELWLAFDVDGSGVDKEIVVHYHRGARALMSVRYNWHADLRRPYRTGVYFPVEHRWRGIGICKQNEQFQKEITTQHRQRLDNATLANMRMIRVSRLSGYGPNEPIFPGKMWFVDNKDDVDTFQLGEIYPSSYSNEQGSLIYSQQRTGVNETVLGMPQMGTPGTATSDLARIQEGNKKFDFIYQNFTEFTADIVMDIMSNIQQFGPRRIGYFDNVEGGDKVRKFLEMPLELVSTGLLIRIRTAGQQQNRILERQNWIQIAPLLNQYYLGLLQLAQPLGDQQLMQTILVKGLYAASEAMRQILEAYDVRNVDRIVVKELEEMMNGARPGANGQPAQPVLGPGADSGPQGTGTIPSMDFLAPFLNGAGGSGNGAASGVS
ncbi:MAG: hypothetical protein H0U60_12695 [Blastocatellia bacterium]|nr:hypothetical protein [Blastocatellia bacterium]